MGTLWLTPSARAVSSVLPTASAVTKPSASTWAIVVSWTVQMTSIAEQLPIYIICARLRLHPVAGEKHGVIDPNLDADNRIKYMHFGGAHVPPRLGADARNAGAHPRDRPAFAHRGDPLIQAQPRQLAPAQYLIIFGVNDRRQLLSFAHTQVEDGGLNFDKDRLWSERHRVLIERTPRRAERGEQHNA